ncbi:MAG: hypothetical protein WA826_04020, partial [Silvibacterium sp.]
YETGNCQPGIREYISLNTRDLEITMCRHEVEVLARLRQLAVHRDLSESLAVFLIGIPQAD